MFDLLDEYENQDHFFFSPDQILKEVCNAPKNASGIYLIYALTKGRVLLYYIGSSGKVETSGKINHQKGGLYNSIVESEQWDKPRRWIWPEKMKEEDIEALDIYWYVTFDKNNDHIPTFLKSMLLQQYFEIHRALPSWNLEL